ncbi:MAG: SpoIID/LytB domain-containing protein [Bacteroidales bacterium]|nr:SpoIID/LytB domain-containing protein [Bacteroidales bacterium]
MNYTEPVIHVGILSAEEIEFVLNGTFIALSGKDYKGKQKAKYIDGKVLFDGKSHDELIFEPIGENTSFDLINVIIGIDFHWERKEDQRFKGALKIIVEDKNITAINRVKVEDYLTSVISSEMSATASGELLKAHAVISRSWLLSNSPLNSPKGELKNPLSENVEYEASSKSPSFGGVGGAFIKWYERDAHAHFDVCADDHCQRYQGITRASTKAVKKAIEITRGEVLMFNKEICDARFSKSCGGASETFENCWAPEHYPYLTKVIDNPTNPEGFELNLTIEANAEKWIRQSPQAFCNTTDKKVLAQVLNNYDQETTDFFRWKVEYTQAELSELVARRSGIDFGQIIDLIPVKRGESGRIIELKIVGTKKNIIVGKELEIRKWLSNSHLYSSAFVVDKSDIVDDIPQHFTLTGAGWGHGVGLCQIGAAVMGEKGYKYKEILLHYFRGAELKKIY